VIFNAVHLGVRIRFFMNKNNGFILIKFYFFEYGALYGSETYVLAGLNIFLLYIGKCFFLCLYLTLSPHILNFFKYFSE